MHAWACRKLNRTWRWSILWGSLLFQVCCFAQAAECRVETVSAAPPKSAEGLARALAAEALKVRLDDETWCELWAARSWACLPEAERPGPTENVLYPLRPGSFLGVMRLATTCYDLRDQEIPAGTYTLRYGVQPDIEAHKGSHDSRDFVILVSCETDKSAEPLADAAKLLELSAGSIGTMHPTFLPLLKPGQPDGRPAVERDQRDPNGWVLRVPSRDTVGKPMTLELILPHTKPGG